MSKKCVKILKKKPRKDCTVGDAQNPKQYNKASNSILQVQNRDNLCLIRAVLIAIAYDKKEINRSDLLRPSNKRMNKETHFIARFLKIPNKMYGICELKKLENYLARKIVYCLTFGDTIPSKSIKLKKILIYVILFEKQFDDKIFETYRTQIYIYNVDNAYDLL